MYYAASDVGLEVEIPKGLAIFFRFALVTNFRGYVITKFSLE